MLAFPAQFVVSDTPPVIEVKGKLIFYNWANYRIYLPFGGVMNKAGKMVMPYIRIGVVVAMLVLVVIFLVLRYTRFGRSLYAVGGSE